MLNVDKAGQIAELQQRAYHIRQHALRMGQVQGQGYVGQALGAADLLAVSYFHAMKYQPENPEWEGRDRFYLSIGHYAIALYAALIEAKTIPLEELETYGADDSRLPMSGMASYTPGMEITGGSLGHGLGIAVGACLGLKQKKSDAFVYNLLSDGELNEGSTWEAVMSASHWKLDNLIAIIDVNNQQADGHSSEILAFEPIVDRWQSFGWYTQRVDGNNMEALLEAFDQARNYKGTCPRVIICDTKMGKGVSFLESREKTHFIRVDEHEWDDALNILTHYGQ
ncbi:TPA: transketolase [Acinetobacter nosocomialis]|uniref:transketolase n=1 Tax=Acinetobacter calcoaceticus/baumannii complex TaxID=909768 RepID=UPI0009E0FD24|nr:MULTISPECIES: transketolase [Acinetobacter calcoaceticus/baumannii complex]ARG18868.1 transketolase [Acinetobacter nosocomialis]MBP1471518.1 transketolase [Acinetobacter nosocomialis]MBR7695364.1 transketolase [Acinetobacter nosocomialis]MCQ1103946.1 transketolase [Acinetobacter baumannii]MDC4995397.1 transketolase [Acinetobacter baumannii]